MSSKNIVLLHGWGASTKRLEPLARELRKKKWNVFVPELPGFDADPPDTAWNLDDYTSYVEKKAKEKYKSYILFGHSFGGRIAIKLASKDNKEIKGVVLCAAGMTARGNIIKRTIFIILAKVGKVFLAIMPLAKAWRKFLYKAAREHDYEKTKGVMKEVFKNVVGEDLKPISSRINKPTLILWGDEDKMTPLSDARYLKRVIRKSKLKIYNNVGHTLPYNNSKRLAKEITAYFS